MRFALALVLTFITCQGLLGSAIAKNYDGLQDKHASVWFSEEDPAMKRDHPIYSVGCKGRYCDNIQLSYYDALKTGSSWESAKYSEEDGKFTCGFGLVIIGIKCSGKYCDNKNYYCARPSNFQIDSGSTYVTPWFSDERNGRSIGGKNYGVQECDPGMVLYGVECSGSYCDNMKLYCVSFKYEHALAGSPTVTQGFLSQYGTLIIFTGIFAVIGYFLGRRSANKNMHVEFDGQNIELVGN